MKLCEQRGDCKTRWRALLQPAATKQTPTFSAALSRDTSSRFTQARFVRPAGSRTHHSAKAPRLLETARPASRGTLCLPHVRPCISSPQPPRLVKLITPQVGPATSYPSVTYRTASTIIALQRSCFFSHTSEAPTMGSNLHGGRCAVSSFDTGALARSSQNFLARLLTWLAAPLRSSNQKFQDCSSLLQQPSSLKTSPDAPSPFVQRRAFMCGGACVRMTASCCVILHQPMSVGLGLPKSPNICKMPLPSPS